MVVRTIVPTTPDGCASLWSIGPDSRIVSVRPETAWPDAETGEAFADLAGKSFDDLSECLTAAEVIGTEVVVVSMAHLQR